MICSIFCRRGSKSLWFRFGFMALLLLSTSVSSYGKEDAIVSEGRAIVIRYDSSQINLGPLLLNPLLNQPERRAEISDQVLRVNISEDQSLKQPPGVYVGILQFYLAEEVDDDALFQSARKALIDSLNERLADPQVQSLTKELENATREIDVRRVRLARLQERLEMIGAEGSPEHVHAMSGDLRRRITELRIQDKVNQIRSKVIQSNLEKLHDERSKLTGELSKMQMNVVETLGRVSSAESLHRKHAALAMQLTEMAEAFGKEHPNARKVANMISQVETQLEVVKDQTNESAEIETQLAALQQERAEMARRYAEAARVHDEQRSQQIVAKEEIEILKQELEGVRETFSGAMKDAPAIQMEIEFMQRELDELRRKQSTLQAKLGALQRVTVEIW